MTTEQNVKKALSDILGVDESEIFMASKFEDDLGGDSLDAVEVVMKLESMYNETFDDRQFGNLHTVGDLVGYIDTNWTA